MLTFDLQGHGRSEAALGLRGYVDRFNDYVDDFQIFLDSISNESGKSPHGPRNGPTLLF